MVLWIGRLWSRHSSVGSWTVGGFLFELRTNNHAGRLQVRTFLQSLAMRWCSWMGALLSRGSCLSRSAKPRFSCSWLECASDVDQSYASSRSLDGWICWILLHSWAGDSYVEFWWCLGEKTIERETSVQTIQMVYGEHRLRCSAEVFSTSKECRLGWSEWRWRDLVVLIDRCNEMF